MAWLWLVTVGRTDLQFPVWKIDTDDFGRVTKIPYQFELKPGDTRNIHEGLLRLCEKDRLHLSAENPEKLDRQDEDKFSLDLQVDDTSAMASINQRGSCNARFQISKEEDCLTLWDSKDTSIDAQLIIYCTKLQPLVEEAKALIGKDTINIIVLNTHRKATHHEGKNEPIASGPIAARFLASQFGLEWVNSQGELPASIPPATCTWVDILKQEDEVENKDTQDRVLAVLNNIMQRWQQGIVSPISQLQVLATTSGGIPDLKPIVMRIPATHIGEINVHLLDKPRRGNYQISALNFNEKWSEREALRFHCAESFRASDYFSAYGFAMRYADLGWTKNVTSYLGTLLEMPPGNNGRRPDYSGRALLPFQRYACQIETRLCAKDLPGAIIRLGVFLESTIWHLLKENTLLKDEQITVNPERKIIETLRCNQDLPAGLIDGGLVKEKSYNGRSIFEVQPSRYFPWYENDKSWPKWLVESSHGSLQTAARSLLALCETYSFRPQKGSGIKELRNKMVHGEGDVNLNELANLVFTEKRIFTGQGQPFGSNFLHSEMMTSLLTHLGSGDLAEKIAQQLQEVLTDVITTTV